MFYMKGEEAKLKLSSDGVNLSASHSRSKHETPLKRAQSVLLSGWYICLSFSQQHCIYTHNSTLAVVHRFSQASIGAETSAQRKE